MNELGKQIVDLLRNAYLGATVYQDSDTMIRISRAVAAFEADPQLDLTKVFTEDMIRSIRTESESPDKLLPDPVPIGKLKDAQWFAVNWPPTLDNVYQRIAVSICGEPGSILVQSLKDGGQGLVHKEERVFPITKDRIQSLPDLIEGDIHEQ